MEPPCRLRTNGEFSSTDNNYQLIRIHSRCLSRADAAVYAGAVPMMTTAAARYTHLRTQCTTRGLRLTPQRDVLLRVLSETAGHPTADDLVQKVREVLPSVS